MNKFSKILSVIMCAVMVLGLVLSIAASAFAAEAITATKVTSGELTSGQYVLLTDAGFAPTVLESDWLQVAQPTVEGDKITDVKGAVINITVVEGGVTLADAKGTQVAPKTTPQDDGTVKYGNQLVAGEFVWGYTYNAENGQFTFTVGDNAKRVLSSALSSQNKIRNYQEVTYSGEQAAKYDIDFTLFKLDSVAAAAPEEINVNELVADASKWTFNGEKHSVANGQLNLGAKDATTAAMLNVPAQNVSYKFSLTINEIGDYNADWWATELLIVARSSVADGGWADGAQTGYTLTSWGDMTEFYIGRSGKDDLSEKIVLNINDGKAHDIEFKVVNNAANTEVTVTLIVDGEVKCEFVDDGSKVKEDRPNLYPNAGNLTIRGNNVGISVGTYEAPPAEITIKEAVALGAAKEHNTYTDGKYILTGKIVEIQNDKYGNIVIEDETGSILIYGLYSADGSVRFDAMETKPQVGDTITVLGVLGQYNETAQMKNGWLQTIHAEQKPVEPNPNPTPGTGDFAIVLAVTAMMASGAMIVLVQKKREF